MSFDRSKIVAILTGVIALILGFAYLILVQVLDSRGAMQPAPPSVVMPAAAMATAAVNQPSNNTLSPCLQLDDGAMACKLPVI